MVAGEGLFEMDIFDDIGEEEVVTGIIINDEDDDIGASSLELLLEDTQEYDFKLEGCIELVDPVRMLASES